MSAKQIARGWTFKELVGTVATGATIPTALGTTGSSFITLKSLGASDRVAFVGALASGAATLVVVGTGAAYLAESVRQIVEPATEEVRDWAARLADFFRSSGVPEPHRQVMISRDKVFCQFIEQALLTSGKPSAVVRAENAIVIAADARDLNVAAETVLGLEYLERADRTVISLKAFGDAAPVAIRRVSDGTYAALWADESGSPVKAVGYNRFGEPEWVFRHAEGNLDRSQTALFDEPLRIDVAETMVAACEEACANYVSMLDWMRDTLPDTHYMQFDDNGTIVVRDRKGKVDNPSGAPAILSADGTPSWVAAGRRIKPTATAPAWVAPAIPSLG